MTILFSAQLLLLAVAGGIFARSMRTVARLESRHPVAAGDAVEVGDEIAHVASGGSYLLRGFGRVAPPLALLGGILIMGRSLAGHGGIEALRAGVAARVAVERASVALFLGVATALLCHMAVRRLLARARDARQVLERRARAGPVRGRRVDSTRFSCSCVCIGRRPRGPDSP